MDNNQQNDVYTNGNIFLIDGNYYNFSDFVDQHPGGKDILYFAVEENSSESTHVDVSNHFFMIHRREFNHSKYKKFLIKETNIGLTVEKETEEEIRLRKFNEELNQAVNRIENEGKKRIISSSNVVIIKVLFAFILYFVSLYMYITKQEFIWSVLLGICMAFVGVTEHEILHGLIAKRHKSLHEVFSWLFNVTFGDRVLWIQQHNIHHHSKTNDFTFDKDITSSEPFVILHPDSLKFFSFSPFQGYFALFILSFYGLAILYDTPRKLVTMKHEDGVSVNDYMKKQQFISIVARVLMTFLVFILPVYFSGSWFRTILLGNIALYVMGFLLVMIFIVSHNFENARKTTVVNSKSHLYWYANQIESSCSYGGLAACLLTNGLNYQIEHHLFPTLAFYDLQSIQPTVKQLCAKYGIRYTYFPSYWENLKSTLIHISHIGKRTIS